METQHRGYNRAWMTALLLGAAALIILIMSIAALQIVTLAGR